MAEFLVYNKDNWMDVISKDRPDLTGKEKVLRKINDDSELNSAEKTAEVFYHTATYNARSQIGDIVEVRENGVGMVGKELQSYALIKVPSILVNKNQYEGSMMDGYMIKYHHRFSLDMSKITLDINKEANLTITQFNNLLTEKI